MNGWTRADLKLLMEILVKSSNKNDQRHYICFWKWRQQFIECKEPYHKLMHGASKVELLPNLCLCGAIFYSHSSKVESWVGE